MKKNQKHPSNRVLLVLNVNKWMNIIFVKLSCISVLLQLVNKQDL